MTHASKTRSVVLAVVAASLVAFAPQTAEGDPPLGGEATGNASAPAVDATRADGTAASDEAASADDAPPFEIPASIASAPERDMSIPRGVAVNEPDAFAGYTLFAPLLSKWIYLIDMQGEVVHRWEATGGPGAWVYLADDGTLLHCQREDANETFSGGGIGGRIQRLAPDSSVLWSWIHSDEQGCLHHDIEPLPNGNLLAIAWEMKGEREALAYGRDPGHVGSKGFWPDRVIEIKPSGTDGAEIVWEWHSWDHVVQDMKPERYAYGGVPDNPGRIDVNGDHRDQPPISEADLERLREDREALQALGYAGGGDDDEEGGEDPGGDWLHTNAIDYNAEHDLIVLSTPHFSELWVIDHSTTTEEAAGSTGGRRGKGGELLWRWGNPRNYGFGDLNDQQLFYQHDPTWIAGNSPDELRLLVYNNGRDRLGEGKGFSSLDELVLPFDPERGFTRGKYEAFGPAEPAWTYADRQGFFSAFISGAQRLPNGNTLACSGVSGRLLEVTRDGRIVWEYRNPFGGDVPPPANAGKAPPLALFRATRLAPDDPGVVALLK